MVRRDSHPVPWGWQCNPCRGRWFATSSPAWSERRAISNGLRTTIKGHLPNTTEDLLAWIRDPQGIDPGSAMPTTRIGEADAHAIVAYPQGLR